ncbi:hypothetical protein Bca4012_082833 [Brassica carinata]
MTPLPPIISDSPRPIFYFTVLIHITSKTVPSTTLLVVLFRQPFRISLQCYLNSASPDSINCYLSEAVPSTILCIVLLRTVSPHLTAMSGEPDISRR